MEIAKYGALYGLLDAAGDERLQSGLDLALKAQEQIRDRPGFALAP
jgi:hypothetical protein